MLLIGEGRGECMFYFVFVLFPRCSYAVETSSDHCEKREWAIFFFLFLVLVFNFCEGREGGRELGWGGGGGGGGRFTYCEVCI